jgi:hypothetical protein
MKIDVDGKVVEVVPENEREMASLDLLWKVIIDCYGNNKKIVPMGHFIPGPDAVARFQIEDFNGGVTVYSEEHFAKDEGTYYCSICNKYMKVAKGAAVPFCCGREMEVID